MNSIVFWSIGVVIVNLVIALFAIVSGRFLQGILFATDVKDQLDNKDNLAFGLSIAAGIVAIGLVMSAAVSGEAHVSLVQEALNVIVYAVTGIILLKIGLVVVDKLIFTSVNIKQQLLSKNTSYGVINAANLVAIGVLIAAAIGWAEDDSWRGVPGTVVIFIISLLVIGFVSVIRRTVYSSRHEGNQWQLALITNPALAVRYAGQLVGSAIVIAAASGLIEYHTDVTSLAVAGLTWLIYAIIGVVVLWLLFRLTLPVVLYKIDVVEEVDNQKNIGIASIEASIYIAFAIIINMMLS